MMTRTVKVILIAALAVSQSSPVVGFLSTKSHSGDSLLPMLHQQQQVVHQHNHQQQHCQQPTSRITQPDINNVFVLAMSSADTTVREDDVIDYEPPEDAVINIKPKAIKRLRELREKQPNPDSVMVLRMGVRNGGCSGLSYVMDFSTEDAIQDDDEVDEYPGEKLKCVVDAKSMLYLYGLELDYSEELIGGGFKFFNPNAEDSCGCGSSFGV